MFMVKEQKEVASHLMEQNKKWKTCRTINNLILVITEKTCNTYPGVDRKESKQAWILVRCDYCNSPMKATGRVQSSILTVIVQLGS